MNRTAVIFCRVSSISDRQSNERQISDLKSLAESRKLKVLRVYQEKISGATKNENRPVLAECLEFCFENQADVLLVSEISRLSRSVDELFKTILLCKEKRLNVYFQKEQLSIFNDSGQEHPFLAIFIAALGSCAQIERENIKFRLQSGLQNYKAKGGKLGRRAGSIKSEERKKEEYREMISLLKRGYSVRNVAKITGRGISTVQRIKNQFINNRNYEEV